uniref:DTW domain-containing family protein n=1 Tax=Rhizophora mucronata TaxID=61149 RepID=A0A2P2KN17_RHIMU
MMMVSITTTKKIANLSNFNTWYCWEREVFLAGHQQILLLCLTLRVMDRPILRRRVVSASNKTTKASSNASARSSNPNELNFGRSCSSERIPMAAAAVQVRSHDGWGLSLCIVDTPVNRDMQARSSSPQSNFVSSCTGV